MHGMHTEDIDLITYASNMERFETKVSSKSCGSGWKSSTLAFLEGGHM